jgi:NADH:ubiquinone oxidoreductase subunit F (NADH-binding)
MTIAPLVVGARQGLVYLRGEYSYLLEPLQATLALRRQAGLLGAAIQGRAGFDFELEIQAGAGGLRALKNLHWLSRWKQTGNAGHSPAVPG